MARMRSLRPDFFLDEDMSDLPIEAHFLLLGLYTLADRDGRLEDRPRRIKAQVFPFREVDVDALLTALAGAGIVARYAAHDGRACLALLTFARDQNPHPKETSFGLPPPPSMESHGISRTSVDVPEASRRLPLGMGDGMGVGSGYGCGSTPSGSAASAPLAPEAEELPDVTETAEEVPEDSPPLVLRAQKPEKPARKPSAGEALHARLEESRKKCCEAAEVPFVPSRWPHARMNRDLGPVARLEADLSKADEWGRFKGAWQAFIEDDEAERLDVPFSLDFFWRMRSRYEGRALKGES